MGAWGLHESCKMGLPSFLMTCNTGEQHDFWGWCYADVRWDEAACRLTMFSLCAVHGNRTARNSDPNFLTKMMLVILKTTSASRHVT